MKIFRYLVALIIVFAAFSAVSAAPYSQIGVNLSDPGAFTDIIKHTNRFNKVESYDENGWPASDFELVLMDQRPAREWAGEIDDPEEFRIDFSGTYKCSFKGTADVSILYNGASVVNKIYTAEENTSYFDLVIPGPPVKGQGLVIMVFSNTTRSAKGATNSGITELKVMRPGYNLDTDKIFTDEYINLCKAANFACYRYYQLQNIWEGEPVFPAVTDWNNRKIPADVCQKPMDKLNGKTDGWSWEYIIELSNILNKDIWICLHISCDSNYVIKLAEKLKRELNPGINIYIENSNEVWSPNFAKNGPYNQAQAAHKGIKFGENYARRTVELSDLFGQVFGQDEINKRIRVVLSGQHSYSARSDVYLNYINDHIGAPNKYIYSLSTGLYFGSTNPDGNPEEFNAGMKEDLHEQISNSTKSTYRFNHLNRAKDWNFTGGCSSYEGGPGSPAGSNMENLDNKILAHRTESMKDVIIKHYGECWFDIGGKLALHFTLSSGYNRYGCWGLTDDFSNPDRNYKMQAIRELIGTWTDVQEDPVADIYEELMIGPNPAVDFIKINFEGHLSEIIIRDIFGKKLVHTDSNENKIDISRLLKGIYFISAYDIISGKYLKAKFIKM